MFKNLDKIGRIGERKVISTEKLKLLKRNECRRKDKKI